MKKIIYIGEDNNNEVVNEDNNSNSQTHDNGNEISRRDNFIIKIYIIQVNERILI